MLALIAVLGLTLPVLGQGPGTTATDNSAQPAQTPYTAEYKIIRVKNVTDGTAVTQESIEVIAMDSRGRQMTATTVLSNEHRAQTTSVLVYDPVAGTNTSWNTKMKRATVAARLPNGSVGSHCFTTEAGDGPVILNTGVMMQRMVYEKGVTEDLGTETILGVEGHGHRITRTTPVGEIGSNKPHTCFFETWLANGIGPVGLVVREIDDDAESGKMSKELVRLNMGEPNPDSFHPPKKYTIVKQQMREIPCQYEGAPVQ